MTMPNGSAHRIGLSRQTASASKRALVGRPELSDVFNVVAQQRSHRVSEPGLLAGLAHLRGDAQWHPGCPCHPAGDVNTFVGVHETKERGVAATPVAHRVLIGATLWWMTAAIGTSPGVHA